MSFLERLINKHYLAFQTGIIDINIPAWWPLIHLGLYFSFDSFCTLQPRWQRKQGDSCILIYAQD